MPDFQALLQQGSAHAWLFVPSAIVLGILHGLEPGHSKTMMAAFIIAIKGTVLQAVLLGLAATVSHTIVVWGIALCGMYLWQGVDTERIEPYFQVASAVIIAGVAAWMLWRTWSEQRSVHAHHDHPDHDHHHHDHHHQADDHEHDPHLEEIHKELATGDYQDAHQRAHANDIRRHFANRAASTGQIVLFGLTGGLIPCPAAITVLLLCLQLRQVSLGFALVLCFSLGLAITLVSVGVVAALSLRHASARWSWIPALAQRAPYVSGALILAVALYVGLQGWAHLPPQAKAAASPVVDSRLTV